MSEKVVCVMTRAQRRENEIVQGEDMKESPAGESCISGSDQQRIIDTYSKTKECVELRFVEKESLKLFCVNNVTFINPISPSQVSPGEFVRELADFCKSINKEEVYLIKKTILMVLCKKK